MMELSGLGFLDAQASTWASLLVDSLPRRHLYPGQLLLHVAQFPLVI